MEEEERSARSGLRLLVGLRLAGASFPRDDGDGFGLQLRMKQVLLALASAYA